MSAPDLQLPPGFRFHPTDEELVMCYLIRKCTNQTIIVPIIAEIDLYKFDPWQLPGLAMYGEKEWYFFSPRDRKYPNGSRPNRAAGTGYWKATGADKPIGVPKPVGIKKALVFYAGRAPKGEKTNWIMHEYRLADVDRSARKKNSLRLDDWVLCRIYNKKGVIEKQPNGLVAREFICPESEDKKPEILMMNAQVVKSVVLPPAVKYSDFVHFDEADSIPKLHTESSCSEQVVLPDIVEVESREKRTMDSGDVLSIEENNPFTYMDATLENALSMNNPFAMNMLGGDYAQCERKQPRDYRVQEMISL